MPLEARSASGNCPTACAEQWTHWSRWHAAAFGKFNANATPVSGGQFEVRAIAGVKKVNVWKPPPELLDVCRGDRPGNDTMVDGDEDLHAVLTATPDVLSGFSPGLFHQPDVTNHHGFVDGFDHVVDRQRSH
jgi:hypothetical protein